MAEQAVAILACLLGSAFFSASETALTSLPITRLESLRERTRGLTHRGLDRWAGSPQELLITILIGNNLVNILASALATEIAHKLTSSGPLALAVGVMTLVILVFGEITPKSMAQIHAERISALVAGPLYLLDRLLTPAVWLLGGLTRRLMRNSSAEAPVTEKDLLFLLQLAHRNAQLGQETRHMIESVLRFSRTVAREVMVPRPLVRTVDRSWTTQKVRRVVVASGYSRFPVVDGSPDAVVGVLHAKALLGLPEDEPWTGLVTEPLFVPETRLLSGLLQEFRTTGQHLALVLDEFGGLAGVVSLEDVLEIVVGEIQDEFDRRRTAGIVDDGDGWIVPGHLSLRRLERLVHRPLEPPGEVDVDSVGGLVAALREDGPDGGALRWNGLVLEVLEEDEDRPLRVRVTPDPAG